MPKRDDEYMQGQRDAIARAALSVLIEKGYHETTLRDICRAADISNGALYSYFPTREAVIIAACAIDHVERLEEQLPSSWHDYAPAPSAQDMEPGTYWSRRFRLSLQFAAEITQMVDYPDGLALIYRSHRKFLRKSLLRLQERGIVSLFLGIEATTEIHVQLSTGVEYQLGSNKEVDRDAVVAAYREGLALSAGLIRPVAN